jgi:hypothetical protein
MQWLFILSMWVLLAGASVKILILDDCEVLYVMKVHLQKLHKK